MAPSLGNPIRTAAHRSTGTRSTERAGEASCCRRCGRDITRIDMVRNGLELEFVSCSTCDTREWMRNGEVVDLDLLLDEMVAAREGTVTPVAAQIPTAEPDPVQLGDNVADNVADIAARFVA